VALAIYIKKCLKVRQKKKYGKLSPCKNIINLPKNPLNETKNTSRYL
jgi:hypothetical protein